MPSVLKMFAQDPAQLLEAFSQLEASNMFQIAAAQEAEAALEAARAAHAATQVGGLWGWVGGELERHERAALIRSDSAMESESHP